VAIDLSSIVQTAFYTTKADGMGLSICCSIVEALWWAAGGGHLRAAGALFQFTVPAD
jgi:hypothetical protein